WSPGDLGAGALGVHPAWLPITLFAARYGVRGLIAALLAIGAPLVGSAVVLASTAEGLFPRINNPADVVALLTAVATAWIGMAQGGRVRRVAAQLEEASTGRDRAEVTGAELADTLAYLRARCDRMDASLTVWRSVAQRLERGRPIEAAQAALELCALRCGAEAGVVQRWAAGEPVIVAWRGAWRRGATRPRDLRDDRTVEAAASTTAMVSAAEVPGATEADSDLAVPILDEMDGSLLGVIALRGIDPTRLRAAELRDLALIAEWLAAPVVRLAAKPRLRAVQEESNR
ncbi:MAG TPA: hypothetical protein VML75_11145, partial [Kofleriaceae bacterium]|nr:hypothetical protein [Kofleriaceae bacterium]